MYGISENTNARQLVVAWFFLASSLLLLAAQPVFAASQGLKYFTNTPLVNQDGEPYRFYDDILKGKVVAINFMYTSCEDSCPLETAKLLQVNRMLGEYVGKNVHMYSISIDPARDTPEVLKNYKKKFNIGSNWQFLTGTQKDIDLIRKKLGMYASGETELSSHNINFIMGNEAMGQWIRRTPFDVPESLVSVLLGRLQKHSLLATTARPDYAAAQSVAAPTEGSDLFLTRCSACHTIGQGDTVGPDLLGVTNSRDPEWLKRWLKEPNVMLKEKDPLAISLYNRYNQVQMPNQKLYEEDIASLITYMAAESRRVFSGLKKPAASVSHIQHAAHH